MQSLSQARSQGQGYRGSDGGATVGTCSCRQHTGSPGGEGLGLRVLDRCCVIFHISHLKQVGVNSHSCFCSSSLRRAGVISPRSAISPLWLCFLRQSLAWLPRLASNSLSSCLCIPEDGIAGVGHCVCLCGWTFYFLMISWCEVSPGYSCSLSFVSQRNCRVLSGESLCAR